MTEREFIAKIHKALDNDIYKWKIHDAYHGGVPDAYYSGQNTRIVGTPTATTRISSGRPIRQ